MRHHAQRARVECVLERVGHRIELVGDALRVGLAERLVQRAVRSQRIRYNFDRGPLFRQPQ